MTSSNKFSIESPYAGLLIVVILAIVLGWPMFGTYFFHPNQHMYAFGGDALTLYYNVAYHACYGNGSHLSSMAYPDGELIFLTDAQGSLALLLSGLRELGLPVCDYAVGIVNGLGVWGYVLSAVFLYFLFLSIPMPVWRAALFGALTAAMAPHLHRLIGHHGLAHTFLLPLTFLWLVRKFNLRKWEWRDLLFFAVLVFFTFNNPYTGFGLCMIILLTSVVTMVRHHKVDSFLGMVSLAGMTPLILLFVYFKINDPYSDRIGLQWGYFHYKASLEGLIAPPNSLMDRGLQLWLGKGFTMDFEALMNLGFPIVLILLIFAGIRIFNKKLIADFQLPEVATAMTWAGLLMFLYASAIIFLPLPRDWVENVLGSMLMFKASARIAWPFWYALVFLAMVLLEITLKRLSFSGYVYTLVLVTLTWLTDYATYRKPMFTETVHPNFFDQNANNEIRSLLEANHISPTNYQGIYLLPKLLTWTDHFHSEPNFFNQFFGMRLSQTTGLPIVSAMLSRMSIGQTAERIEFLSDPLIKKSLHKRFPNSKPLLILRGKGETQLKAGELYLMSICDTILEHKDFTLFSLPLDRVNSYSLLKEISDGRITNNGSLNADNFFYLEGLQDNGNKNYAGKKSIEVNKGESEIASFRLAKALDSVYHFSAWSYIDPSKYDLGQWSLRSYDQQGKEVARTDINLNQSSEVHDQWVRVDMEVKVCENCSYKIYFNTNKKSWVDEIVFRPKSQYHFIDQAGTKVYNGFRIDP
ncbi:MAG: hypothetical protein IPN73_18990 [Saprospiraceae bacterium]|nr:hypothetical protein [Saprospiraceae bacterium]